VPSANDDHEINSSLNDSFEEEDVKLKKKGKEERKTPKPKKSPKKT
jgi:hypothetical protein